MPGLFFTHWSASLLNRIASVSLVGVRTERKLPYWLVPAMIKVNKMPANKKERLPPVHNVAHPGFIQPCFSAFTCFCRAASFCFSCSVISAKGKTIPGAYLIRRSRIRCYPLAGSKLNRSMACGIVKQPSSISRQIPWNLIAFTDTMLLINCYNER
jgi:hypothetical protein